jgi:uncharacterized protein (DUF1501 family)
MADSWFGGKHTAINAWSSEEGSTLSPHIAQPMESSNTGDPRFNGTTPTTHDWSSDVLVTTGMTRGGGAMAK